MGAIRSIPRPGARCRRAARLGTLAAFAACVLVAVVPAAAGPLTGGFSPTIVAGKADLNGNGVVNGSDDSNAFYGDTQHHRRQARLRRLGLDAE